jgi:ubiquinone/menaquinone biosynthesis C-methylase UbiE
MGSKVYFDTVASEWSEMRKAFFSEAIREKAFGAVNLEAGKLAADIGAGTGFISQGLAARGVKVIAVDQSEAMLLELSKKHSQSGEIDCRPGDAEQLPIDNETVHYTFANMSLHHVENPAAAIKEMARILKPKGRLVITDLDRHDVEFLRREHHDRWMGFEREDIKNWFVEAGFTAVSVDDAGGDCCTDACQTPASASVSIFVASGEKI